MKNLEENKVIEKLLQLKEHYKKVRKNTDCKKTEMDDCESCKADLRLSVRLKTIDECIQLVKDESETTTQTEIRR